MESELYSAESLPFDISDGFPSIGEGRKERAISRNSVIPMASGHEEVAKIGTSSPANTAVLTPEITSSAESSSPLR